MPLTTRWYDDEQTIILFTYSQGWTWDEFDEAMETGMAMIKTVSHRVDMLADFTHSRSLPDQALAKVRNAFDQFPPNAGIIMIVGANRLIQMLLATFQRIYPALGRRFAFALTVEQGLETLRRA